MKLKKLGLLASILLFTMTAYPQQDENDCFLEYIDCTGLAERFLLQDKVVFGMEEPSEKSQRQFISAMRQCATTFFACGA